MEESERDAAVAAHLKELDDELARLKNLEAAMDRRLAEAEDEQRAIAEGTREVAERPPDEPPPA